MITLRDEIDRMFDEFTGGFREGDEGMARLVPAADLIENKDNFVVTAELPGIRKEDIKVTVQNNMLIISGEKKKETENKGDTWHRVERSYGSFNRTFDLPALIDANKINAEFKDGILRVHLPKVEEAKPKEIAIGVK
jgi:HSP20 family protein